VKKADLHCSYSAPVRVSDADVVAARAETFLWLVALERVVVALVAVFGINTDTGFDERAATVVFNGVRDVIERVALAVVVCVLAWVAVFVRDTVFSPRTAPIASKTQQDTAQIKSKIFFISGFDFSKIIKRRASKIARKRHKKIKIFSFFLLQKL
jgi:hypothetical protein